jgi:hypothetical protein
MKTRHTWKRVIAPWVMTLTLAGTALVQTAGTAKRKMASDIPPEITTPDKVETRLGTLKFFDGLPDKDTGQKVYDNLDFLRGVEVFLNTMPGASPVAMRHGYRDIGAMARSPFSRRSWIPSRCG